MKAKLENTRRLVSQIQDSPPNFFLLSLSEAFWKEHFLSPLGVKQTRHKTISLLEHRVLLSRAYTQIWHNRNNLLGKKINRCLLVLTAIELGCFWNGYNSYLSFTLHEEFSEITILSIQLSVLYTLFLNVKLKTLGNIRGNYVEVGVQNNEKGIKRAWVKISEFWIAKSVYIFFCISRFHEK